LSAEIDNRPDEGTCQEECLHGDTALLRCHICEGKGGWDVCGGQCCGHGKHKQTEVCTERCVTQREVHADW